jgi:hypothetical protein
MERGLFMQSTYVGEITVNSLCCATAMRRPHYRHSNLQCTRCGQLCTRSAGQVAKTWIVQRRRMQKLSRPGPHQICRCRWHGASRCIHSTCGTGYRGRWRCCASRRYVGLGANRPAGYAQSAQSVRLAGVLAEITTKHILLRNEFCENAVRCGRN